MDWTNRLKFQHLRLLVTIAEQGSMTLASEKMNISQPALSKWLSGLEEELGFSVFERHSKGVRPSAGGMLLLGHARRLLNDLDRSRDDIAAFRRGGRGSLLIGSSPVATDTVARAILPFANAYPDVHINIVENIMAPLLQQLLAGKLDVVIGRMDGESLQLALNHKALYTEPVCFVARPGHPLAGQQAVSWEDIGRYRWIVWPRGTPIRTSLDGALVNVGNALPNNHIESASMIVTLNMLSSSDMLSILSLHQARHYEASGRVAILATPLMEQQGTVGVFWSREEQTPEAVTAFLRYLSHP